MIGASSVPVVVALFCFISNSVSYPALRPVLSRPFRPQTLYASEISPAAASTGNRTEIGTAEDSWPRVSWTAAAQGTVVVKDNKRTVEQYMALPASEYSVLSASQIQRIGDSEFVCTLPTMNFFGTKITPTLYVDVLVYPEDAKAEIIVSRAETSGSGMQYKIYTLPFQ